MDNTPSQTIKGRLLVVDDDPGVRQTLSALLSREGYETRCAPDGKTALMFAEADSPELILLDVRLPDLDGFEVCRCLKGFGDVVHAPRFKPPDLVPRVVEAAEEDNGNPAGSF
jgi:CheY-like chemotaxis protein